MDSYWHRAPVLQAAFSFRGGLMMASMACGAALVTPVKKNLLLKCQVAPAAGARPCPKFWQQLGRAKWLHGAFVPRCPSMRQLGHKDLFVAAQDPVQKDPKVSGVLQGMGHCERKRGPMIFGCHHGLGCHV